MQSSGEVTPDLPAPVTGTSERLASLDFIRGIAVMGILVANIIAFGQPMTAYLYPDAFTVPHSEAEDWLWVAQLVLIDGKMRGLFSLLFGVGLLLFMDKAWVKGRTRWLQVRRLCWLALFGMAHFFLLWRGDILFLYAVAGAFALLFAKLNRRHLMTLGLVGYVLGALLYAGMLGTLQIVADTDVGAQPELAEFSDGLEEGKDTDLADGRLDTALISQGRYAAWVTHNFTDHLSDLGSMVLVFGFETLPLMLIGMALYRYGVFDGSANPKKLRKWGWIMVVIGTGLTVPLALWTKADGLTYYGTLAAMAGYSMLPRLPVIIGLAFLLSLWGSSANGWLAQRISAAGRAAFTNYLGTSLLLVLIFHGWAGGLFGQLGRVELYLVALLTSILMLAWSKPWLERYRYGPLEWLWRCLTYGRLFPLKRDVQGATSQ